MAWRHCASAEVWGWRWRWKTRCDRAANLFEVTAGYSNFDMGSIMQRRSSPWEHPSPRFDGRDLTPGPRLRD
ncbi:hypothetical protein SBA1_1040083 [Candidatus Sulfotelmatobacter kueseliae]|uniref:Uncharacterized protein n=1 Tax=Candidatus Sulfotelmatobacter kueseliae TaxID=2042962 RepID=A0A2U3JY13_9BACT|nr:hypothetical protein SBA1_1040083 [Candidatus Sulfotelmatobacter kueseliae]